MFDIVVVGGGVAGLTAALFGARYGRSTLCFVPDIPGGHLATIDAVEDFPGFAGAVAGYWLGPTIQEQAEAAGAEFRMASVDGIGALGGGWKLATGDGDIEARTVIIATGSRNRPLGVPGEEQLLGKGVSHCASCDGPMLRGKPVAVVGAGDSGLQEALTLAGFASEVMVIHRSERPHAQAVYRQRVLENPTITLRGNTVVEEVPGDAAVEGLRVRDLVTGETAHVAAAAVFVYTGLDPNTEFLRGALRLDASGRIPTDVWMRTELPGLFAAGDVRSHSASQAVTAAGDGATAALAAHRYLEGLG